MSGDGSRAVPGSKHAGTEEHGETSRTTTKERKPRPACKSGTPSHRRKAGHHRPGPPHRRPGTRSRPKPEAETDAHPGYEANPGAGDDSGNSRNGHRPKTLIGQDGARIEIPTPRDRAGRFAPVVAPRSASAARTACRDRAPAACAGEWRQGTSRPASRPSTARASRVRRCRTSWRRSRSGCAPGGSVPRIRSMPRFTDAIHAKVREATVARRPVHVALGDTTEEKRGIPGMQSCGRAWST